MGLWGLRKNLFLFVIALGFSFFAVAEEVRPLTPEIVEALHVPQAPYIQGDVLYINGPLTSDLYNYFAYEATALQKVKVIELNSLGGNIYWTLLVAEKVRAMNITTRVSQGNFCASSCVFLFTAGAQREMHFATWLGLHAAHVDSSVMDEFNSRCVNADQAIDTTLSGCSKFLDFWRKSIIDSTNEAFDFMEAGGVSPKLRENYFADLKQKGWYEDPMFLAKSSNWLIIPKQARYFYLATKVIGAGEK